MHNISPLNKNDKTHTLGVEAVDCKKGMKKMLARILSFHLMFRFSVISTGKYAKKSYWIFH